MARAAGDERFDDGRAPPRREWRREPRRARAEPPARRARTPERTRHLFRILGRRCYAIRPLFWPRSPSSSSPRRPAPARSAGPLAPVAGQNVRVNDPSADVDGHTNSTSSVAARGSVVIVGLRRRERARGLRLRPVHGRRQHVPARESPGGRGRPEPRRSGRGVRPERRDLLRHVAQARATASASSPRACPRTPRSRGRAPRRARSPGMSTTRRTRTGSRWTTRPRSTGETSTCRGRTSRRTTAARSSSSRAPRTAGSRFGAPVALSAVDGSQVVAGLVHRDRPERRGLRRRISTATSGASESR